MAIVLQSRETQLGETFQSFEFEVVDITLDTSYPTGGSINVAATVGEAVEGVAGPEGSSTGNIVAMIPIGPVSTSGTASYMCVYHPETDKLQVFWTGGAISTAFAEVTNATNLSAVTFRFLVLARGS